jgi:hypothetical protein
MAEGNRTDIGSLVSMLGQVLNTVDRLSIDMGQLTHDLGQFKTETKRECSLVHADMAAVRTELAQYHGFVMGHGMPVTEVQARLSRIEDHLNFPPIGSH